MRLGPGSSFLSCQDLVARPGGSRALPVVGLLGRRTEVTPILPWDWEGSSGTSSPLEAPEARGWGIRTGALDDCPALCSLPRPPGLSQGRVHPLPLGCGHWAHTSCSRAENIPFPVLPKGPRESGLVWGRKMGMQRKWAEGPKGDTSTRWSLARRHVKSSHHVQTQGGRRPSGKSSAASGATSRHGAAGDPLQSLRGCVRRWTTPRVTSLWSSRVQTTVQMALVPGGLAAASGAFRGVPIAW